MNKINFNDNWEYTTVDVEFNKDFARNMTLFSAVTLPHDYSVENPFDKTNPSGNRGGYLPTTTLWYRKYFEVSKVECGSYFVLFDGVYNNATVYINGIEVTHNEYGYLGFCVDIRQQITDGVNLIAVKVDGSKEPSSRWYNGQGIFRNVWLMTGGEAYIKNDGVYLKQILCDSDEAVVHTEVKLVTLTSKIVSALIKIKDIEDNVISVARNEVQTIAGENILKTELKIKSPTMWDCENPYLYSCIVEILNENDMILDSYELKLGLRTTEFVPNKGFYLNGKHTLFKGVCLHHDGGCVGAAVPKALWHKRLLMLKDMGCNAVRTSHNPFSPEFYDLCDELGIMVIDEIFDGWEKPKVAYDYSTIWEKCHVKNLQDFIVRDRNHPSVVMWSIGNEVIAMNPEITNELMAIVRELDDTRRITAGVLGTSEVSESNRAILDVAGYNDGGGGCFIYEFDHQKRENQLLIATESPHTVQTRGYYRTQTWWRDKGQPRKEIENLTEQEIFFDQNIHYNSSYDNSGVRLCARDSWELVETLPYLCGEFRWTGFDYIGEANPMAWPTKTHDFGIIDTANFPKDHYYFYKSVWSDTPFVHILPHWTHTDMPLGTVVPVWVYTNAECAELFVNGESLGIKKKHGTRELEWLVPYYEGTITATGYIESKAICTATHATAGQPVKIAVTNEPLPQCEEKQISQLTFMVQDGQDVFVPYSNNITGIYLSPNVQLLGSDNGAIDDMTPYKSQQRRAFNGLGMYLVEYDTTLQSYAIITSVLGRQFFEDCTQVAICIDTIALSDVLVGDYTVYYTTDTSTPSERSQRYSKPFSIDNTTTVRTAVYHEGVKIIELSELFVKGLPEKIIDTEHGNKPLALPQTNGKLAEILIGEWRNNACSYILNADGTVERKLGITQDVIGSWWCELSENSNSYLGEILLSTARKFAITLDCDNKDELRLDNSGGQMGNIVVNINTVTLKRNKTMINRQVQNIKF